MDRIFDDLFERIREMLIDAILNNIAGTFATFVEQTEAAAAILENTPASFNPTVYNMIYSLSMAVIMPIAVAIFAIIIAYELMSMLAERNSFENFDMYSFLIWTGKIVIGVILLTNVFNIIEIIFTVGAAAVTGGSTYLTGGALDFEATFVAFEAAL